MIWLTRKAEQYGIKHILNDVRDLALRHTIPDHFLFVIIHQSCPCLMVTRRAQFSPFLK
jgi:hypothetical protein